MSQTPSHEHPCRYPPFDFELDMPNPFTWCDMTDPFLNPFCPTWNPIFNILIKMMIPGAIRPAIDNIEQKLMTGQEIALQIYKLLIVPADGGGDRGGPDPKGLVLDNTDNGIDNGMLELASSPGRILVLAAACGFPPL